VPTTEWERTTASAATDASERCARLLAMDVRVSSRLQRLRHLRDALGVAVCRPLAILATASSSRGLILADAQAWRKNGFGFGVEGIEAQFRLLTLLLARERAFRNLLYYRLSHDSRLAIHVLLPILRFIWRPQPTLYLGPDSLEPGCFILHGLSTIVMARSIGRNFSVWQQVTIGYAAANQYPTIGDDVTVMTGAIVLGDITVGDGATIGAGAVVVSDVPPGSTIEGVPARAIRRDEAR